MTGQWKFAFRNLARNRRRNVATGLAIALGFTGLFLLGGYALRVESFLRTNAVYLQHLGHLAVYKHDGLSRFAARPKQYGLSAGEQQAVLAVLARMREIEFTGRYLVGRGLVGNGCRSLPFIALGLEPETERKILTHPAVLHDSPELARPTRGVSLPDAQRIPGAAGLSTGLALLLDKERVHDELPHASRGFVVPDCDTVEGRSALSADANVQLATLTYDGSLSAVDAEVVNVFRTPLAATEDNSVVTTLSHLQELLETDRVTYVAAFLHEGADAGLLARRAQDMLRSAGLSVDVYAYDDGRVNPYYVGTMAVIGSIATFFGVLVTCVVALSVLNTMTLALLERTRELGTLRALGYRVGQLRGLFLREALLLAICSTLAGLALGGAIAFSINVAQIRFQPPGVSGTMQLLILPTARLVGVLTLGMAVLSLAATYVAVARRSRERVAQLLIHTGA